MTTPLTAVAWPGLLGAAALCAAVTLTTAAVCAARVTRPRAASGTRATRWRPGRCTVTGRRLADERTWNGWYY
ncbi:hypothetical protein [Kitasatospora griseola]|uniref:hypothetical protein n=1 Tax=Kitasatospora griseola TaxID=2064 RepID=UPI0016714E32|nr:hypothetical protein [Kitasatospora griseola]